ncbi:hypothetical protein L6164_036381 [Bauhinia variegata]|uniref:Uncharacterized protein n=1 Tax=Bauhinia variegata TaxID=167791 RepID=A0ACB9KGW2_BAUVA|nr:hypothetical protein L6164_036381 [Bauhinia variegata]
MQSIFLPVPAEAKTSTQLPLPNGERQELLIILKRKKKMIDDQGLGFVANYLGIVIFALVIAYHYVMADPKYEGS